MEINLNLHLSSQRLKNVAAKQLVHNTCYCFFVIILDAEVVLEHHAGQSDQQASALRGAAAITHLMLDSSCDQSVVSTRRRGGSWE
jgi:hypothetical protein